MTLARSAKAAARQVVAGFAGPKRAAAWFGTLRRGWDARTRGAALADMRGDMRTLCNHVERYAVPVTQPLVLISQVHRSGGTLLSQLFDGHPQLHAHPFELKIGYPEKWVWPQLDLAAGADAWFRTLFEMPTLKLFNEGYRKGRPHDAPERFLLPPTLQRHLFMAALRGVARPSVRDVLDAYMTSYFNAWLDNRNLEGSKRAVAGFAARLGMAPDNTEAFFAAYPDGRLIAIVRDPCDWYASVKGHAERPETASPEIAAELWCRGTRAGLRDLDRFGAARVALVRFADLVGRTDAVMRDLSNFIGIDFDASLIEPTFNGRPIRANSSFGVADYGIRPEVLDRGATLAADESAVVRRITDVVHQEALARCRTV